MENLILKQVTKDIIKGVINELDVYSVRQEVSEEQYCNLRVISEKLRFILEDLELIISEAVSKVYEKKCLLEDDSCLNIESDDVGIDIYNALKKMISMNMDSEVIDTKGNVVEKISILDDDLSISYKVSDDKLYIQHNFIDVLEIKKDGKSLENLLDFIDEAMRD